MQTSDGGFLLAGYSASNISGNKSQASKGAFDYWIIKINANGIKVWDKTFGGSGEDYLKTIIATSDGGFLLGGYSPSGISGDKSEASKGNHDYWLIKINSDGNKIWDKTLGGNGQDFLSSIVSVNDGGFLLAGFSQSGISGDKSEVSKGSWDYWLVKINANGTKLWDKTFGGSGSDYLFDVSTTNDGGYILGGYSTSGISGDKSEASKGSADYWLVKINGNGVKTWDKTFGGNGDDFFTSMTLTADGGCILGGYSNSGISSDKSEALKGGYDYWLIKANTNGAKVWDKTFGGSGDENLTSIISSTDGGILLGGYSTSGISGDKSQTVSGMNDFWIVKTSLCDPSNILSTQNPTLTASGCAGTVTWSNGAKASSIKVNPLTTTAYSATCTVNDCVSNTSNVITVTVPPKPTTPTITTNKATICIGTSAILTASACIGGTLTWTGGLTGNSITVSPTSNKSYKVVCTQNGISSDSSATVSINVTAKPNAPTISSNIICTNPILAKWNKTPGGNSDEGLTSMIPTSDGGYLLGGYSNSGISGDKSEASKGDYDYWIVKVNANGGKAWDKTFGGSGNDDLKTIIATPDGGYLLGGASNSSNEYKSQASKGDADFWVVKINAEGNKVWDKTFGGNGDDNLRKIVATNDGGFILSGYSSSGMNGDKSQTSNGGYDYWVVKINADGTKIWDKSFGGNNNDIQVSTIATPDGGYLLGGASYSSISGVKSEISKGDSDFWVVKINAEGTKVWDKAYGGSLMDNLRVMVNTSDGGFLLGGNSDSDASGNNSVTAKGKGDYWLIKINADGTKVWDKAFGGSEYDEITSIITTSDGYLLSSFSASGMSGDKSEVSKGGYDYWLVKIKTDGTKIWDKAFGGSNNDILSNIAPTTDGGLLLAGTSSSNINSDKSEASKGGNDYWLIKVNLCDPNNLSSAQNPTLTASGCIGTVTWSNNARGNSITVSPAETTTYTAKCTVNTCESSVSNAITVTAPTQPATPTISANTTTICVGTNVILTASACSGGRLTWTDGLTGNYLSVYPMLSKSYRVICTQQGISSDSSAAISINVTPKPNAPSINSNITCSNPIIAQWNRIFGGNSLDDLTSMIATSDGGYLLGGYAYSDTAGYYNSNYWVVKVNANGGKVWDKTFGGGKEDELKSMIETSDGGYLLGGSYNNPYPVGADEYGNEIWSPQSYWIVKIDREGREIWNKEFGGSSDSYFSSILATPDGGYLLGGYSLSDKTEIKTENSKGSFDYWLIKINANGIKDWDKTFGGNSSDYLTSIVATNDGGYLLGGSSRSSKSGDKSEEFKGADDYWIIKIDANGIKVWDKTFGGSQADALTSMIATNDGGYLLGGSSRSSKSGDKSEVSKGGDDYWVIKINSNGDKLWDKSFGGNEYDNLSSMLSMTDGGFLLGGTSNSGMNGDKSEASKGSYDYWLVKIKADGTKVWDKTLGGNDQDYFTNIIATSDGSYLLGGASSSSISGDKSEDSIGETDFWVIKANICDDTKNSSTQNPTLTALGCTGNVTWSNGATGNSITVSPTVSTTYTATCSVNGCSSIASNAITVSPDIVNNSSMYEAAKTSRVEVTQAEPTSISFSVFPNPATNEISVETDLNGETTFQLYNSIGQKVIEKSFVKKTKISVGEISRGSHFYLIQNQEIRSTGKVLLE